MKSLEKIYFSSYVFFACVSVNAGNMWRKIEKDLYVWLLGSAIILGGPIVWKFFRGRPEAKEQLESWSFGLFLLVVGIPAIVLAAKSWK